uniref:Protein sieve element occlusion B-like n=1 Tax=Tanacetum cinerariifolium TaxID=118510 RepID=A0A6L2M504_TANCI|nr:protein sieve element occlusion B-like [Tanacetum cinerariifolium]
MQHQQQQQLVKKERRMFTSSDDSAMMKQVVATHSPDGRDMVLKPILHVIEETLHHAIPASIEGVIYGTHNGHVNALAREEKAGFTGFDDVDGIPDGLAHVIHKISCEFSCKSSGGADAHASTIAILNKLSDYTWEAKVVISLGAFSVNVGEFWLVAQLFATNPLAKSLALLKELPNIMEHYKSLEPRFDAVNVIIKAMLEVTKCIIEFKNLPCQYLQDDTPPKSTALTHIPTAAYWCIKSMVACTTQLTSLLGMNYEYMTATSDAWELAILDNKVHNIHKHLKEHLLCNQKIEEKQHDEYFQMLVRIFDVTQSDNLTHSDNLTVIEALFCAKDKFCPLLDGSNQVHQAWHFEKKPILVVLDPQGRVASPNALHMVWIWRNIAYPFTSKKEDALWKEESWSLKLLVESTDKHILPLIAEEEYICLYGGDDLKWIRSFTKLAADTAKEAEIRLNMVYMGKSGTIERIRKTSTTIKEEQLNHTRPDPTSVWYYWTHLESMLHSKMQHGKSYKDEPIMKEVITMMSFDGSDQGWALICKGSSEMARANADLALMSLTGYENWELDAQQIGFVPALRAYLAKLHTPQHCNRLILPGISGGIPEHQPQQQQLVKKERTMFTSSDDSEMMKQIVATHSLDGRDMDLEPILHITEKTPRHAFSASIEIVIDICTILYIIKALICAKHDIHPLLDGSSKTRVKVDVLRKKTVLLIISDLDISHEEVLVLTRIYKESRRVQPDLHYEVVWKPILVVLDPQGRVTSPNALHMVWIWGNIAYPFTSIKDDSLWKEQSRTLELLVDSIDGNRLDWIVEEKYICLYGDDLNWIRSFRKLAADIAHHAGIQLEMVYVGKSGTIERLSAIISEEKLSHTWPDPTSELMTMMSFDGSNQGWALICKGSSGMARAKADLAPMSLTEYEN